MKRFRDSRAGWPYTWSGTKLKFSHLSPSQRRDELFLERSVLGLWTKLARGKIPHGVGPPLLCFTECLPVCGLPFCEPWPYVLVRVELPSSAHWGLGGGVPRHLARWAGPLCQVARAIPPIRRAPCPSPRPLVGRS